MKGEEFAENNVKGSLRDRLIEPLIVRENVIDYMIDRVIEFLD